MKYAKRIIFPWLALMYPTNAMAVEEYLMSKQLLTLFHVERSVTWEKARGNLQGRSLFHPDGTVIVAWNNLARSGSDFGNWKISENLLCIRYRKVHSGTERCYKFKKINSKEFHAVDMDGKLAFKYLLD